MTCRISTGATSGAGTAYPFRAPEFIPFFCGVHVAQSFKWSHELSYHDAGSSDISL